MSCSSSSSAASLTEKRAARERLHRLVSETSHGDVRETMLNAYRLKSEMHAREAATQRPSSPTCFIRTLDPILILPERRFEHCRGARISPAANNTYKSVVENMPRKCSSPSKVHNRLATTESFPAAYRTKFDEHTVTVSGDFIENPRRAASLLKSTTNAELNIPGRSADFKSEVRWRLMLRNDHEC